MSLPAIDFATISETAKQALAAYGTTVEFIEAGASSGRSIRAVIYRDGAQVQSMIADADSSDAVAILNPDEFATPNRMPQKFDQIRVSIAGLSKTYTMSSDPAPILAANTLPLLLVRLRAN